MQRNNEEIQRGYIGEEGVIFALSEQREGESNSEKSSYDFAQNLNFIMEEYFVTIMIGVVTLIVIAMIALKVSKKRTFNAHYHNTTITNEECLRHFEITKADFQELVEKFNQTAKLEERIRTVRTEINNTTFPNVNIGMKSQLITTVNELEIITNEVVEMYFRMMSISKEEYLQTRFASSKLNGLDVVVEVEEWLMKGYGCKLQITQCNKRERLLQTTAVILTIIGEISYLLRRVEQPLYDSVMQNHPQLMIDVMSDLKRQYPDYCNSNSNLNSSCPFHNSNINNNNNNNNNMNVNNVNNNNVNITRVKRMINASQIDALTEKWKLFIKNNNNNIKIQILLAKQLQKIFGDKNSVHAWKFEDAQLFKSAQNVKHISKHTQCIFAAQAVVWGNPSHPFEYFSNIENDRHYNEDDEFCFRDVITSFENDPPDVIIEKILQSFESFMPSLPYLIRLCLSQPFSENYGENEIDGFAFEFRDRSVGESPKNLSITTTALIVYLFYHNPTSTSLANFQRYMMDKFWDNLYCSTSFFVTSFAPCYPENSSRYGFGAKHTYILYQPNFVFERNKIPKPTLHHIEDTQFVKRSGKKVKNIRRIIQDNFAAHGRDYSDLKRQFLTLFSDHFVLPLPGMPFIPWYVYLYEIIDVHKRSSYSTNLFDK